MGQRVLAEFGVIRVEYGMLRIRCRSGGNYWIEIDSGRTYRDKTFLNAEELQPKFIEALEPDDNPRITKGNVRDCKPSTRGMSGVKKKSPAEAGLVSA